LASLEAFSNTDVSTESIPDKDLRAMVGNMMELYSDLKSAQDTMSEYSFGMNRTMNEMALIKAEEAFQEYYDEISPDGIAQIQAYIADSLSSEPLLMVTKSVDSAPVTCPL
jgi:hypothetical protein